MIDIVFSLHYYNKYQIVFILQQKDVKIINTCYYKIQQVYRSNHNSSQIFEGRSQENVNSVNTLLFADQNL